MKKKIAVVIVVTLLAVTIAVSLDACKGSTATAASPSSRSATQTKLLAQWKTDLAELVKDGTINQSQSDDILQALSNMNQQFGSRSGSRPTGSWSGRRFSGSRPSGGWSGSRPSESWSGSRPSGKSGRSGGFGLTGVLSPLVQEGVITQNQADAVSKKLSSGFRTSAPSSNSSAPDGTGVSG